MPVSDQVVVGRVSDRYTESIKGNESLIEKGDNKMISLATKHNDPDARLGWPERIGYGTGNLGMNMINAVLGSFLTIYFTNVALLDAGVIASIIAVSKIFDGVSDLIVGRLVDGTHSKYGKARVWLMRMCIPFAVTTVLLFWVPPMFPTMLKYVYVFLMYNIVNAVCYTAMLVPYFSMISLISQNSYERGFLGNVQQIFSTLGNVVINSIFVALLTKFTSDAENIYTQQAFTLTMSVICIVMVVLAIVCVIFTKERVGVIRTEEEKAAEAKSKESDATTLETVKALLTNKYWIMLTIAMFVVFFVIIMYAVGAVYYAQYIFDDMGQYSWMANSISIAQFVTMFVTPIIMTKVDKRWIYTAGIGVLSLGFLGFGLFGSSIPIMMVCNVFKGIGLGMSGGMALGMVADTITYGNLKSGINTVGMGNAGVSAAQKLGMGLGTAVLGWVLSAAGFDGALPAAEQPATVITAIQFLYTWLPLIMCVIVLVIMTFFYNIKKDLAGMQGK